VRKPADAQAYQTRTLADAERDAQIARAQEHARETELTAGADATRVKAAAQAVDPAPSTSNGTAPEVHEPRPVPAGRGSARHSLLGMSAKPLP
jgi:hypothetical protein